MLKIKDLRTVQKVLQEFDWDLHLIYDENLLDVCNIGEEEKKHFKLMSNLVMRCRIDSKDEKKILTLEYVIEETEIAGMCRSMTEFVTSALIQQAKIDVLNRQKKKLFTINCHLKKHVPDWHITFGTKQDVLRLICEYEIENVKMV